MYDPHQDAARRGIAIEYQDLEGDLLGLWDGRRILLTPGMSQREERCVLAHELVHAELDPPLIHKSYSQKAEKRADLKAAERLIERSLFLELSKYMEAGELAIELGVTGWILDAYMQAYPVQVTAGGESDSVDGFEVHDIRVEGDLYNIDLSEYEVGCGTCNPQLRQDIADYGL